MGDVLEFEAGKYARLVEAGRTDPESRRLASIYAQRYPNRLAREQRLADAAAEGDRAALLTLYKEYLPPSPELDHYEALQADSATVAMLHYRSSGNRVKIEQQREARDAKIAELDAVIAAARGETPEAPRPIAEFAKLVTDHLSGPQQLGGTPPSDPPPEAA